MAKPNQSGRSLNQPIFSDINFICQASMLMAGKHNTLSAYYGRLCKRISMKTRQRMSSDIKRSLCKRCSVGQKPGITSELLIVSSRKNEEDDKSNKGSDNKNIEDINNISKRRKRIRRGKKSKQPKQEPHQQQQIVHNSTRIIDEHKHMMLQCSICGFQRSFRINSNYSIWVEKSTHNANKTKASKVSVSEKTNAGSNIKVTSSANHNHI